MSHSPCVQTINVIAINPKLRQGRPYIIGTSVTVADIAIAKNYHSQNADNIAEWYGLTLPQVHSALAYYYEHKAEVDQTIRHQIKRAEAFKTRRVGSENSLLP